MAAKYLRRYDWQCAGGVYRRKNCCGCHAGSPYFYGNPSQYHAAQYAPVAYGGHLAGVIRLWCGKGYRRTGKGSGNPVFLCVSSFCAVVVCRCTDGRGGIFPPCGIAEAGWTAAGSGFCAAVVSGDDIPAVSAAFSGKAGKRTEKPFCCLFADYISDDGGHISLPDGLWGRGFVP